MKDSQWKWDNHYRRSNEVKCEGKRIFNSFAEACSFNKRAGRFLRGNKKREHLHVYKCYSCGQWHIGHEPSRKAREDWA